VENGALSIDDFQSAIGASDDTILGLADETRTLSEEWQIFKNQALMAIEPVATKVFNLLRDGAKWIMTNVVPAVQSLVGWLGDNKDILIVLGATIGGALAAYATYRGVVMGMAVAKRAWAVATLLANTNMKTLNATMRANPVGLIVTAIGLLVGGLVLAYQKSETFRNIVQSVWEWVKSAASAIGDAFVAALNWLTDAFGWVTDAISGAWDFIQRWWRALIMLAGPIGLAVNAIVWLAQNFDMVKDVATTAWQMIQEAVSFAWNNVIRPAWDAMKTGLEFLGAAFTWIWENIIQPTWTMVGNIISWLWDNVAKPAWENMQTGLDTLGGWFNSISSTIEAVWSWLGDRLKWVKENVVDKVFDGIKTGLELVRDTFDRIVKGIEKVWDGLKEGVAIPVRWVIDKVWNGGIVKAWNAVSVLIPGMEKIDEQVVNFATGGHVRGPGTATSDSIPAMLSNGEYVLSAKAVDTIGVDNLDRFHQQARAGMKPPPAEGMFAGVEGIIKLATGGSVDAALDRVKNFMRGEHGKPYQYGGVGNPSWDCSGLWSGIVHVINGRPATSGRLFTTESDFDAMGWRPGLNGQVAIGISRGGGGPNSHMAGTVDGVNAESGGSHGVQWGGAAIGADHSSFNIHYHLPEVGGEFVSGGGGGGGSSPGAFRRMIAGMFDAIVNPIGRMIPDFGDTLPAQLPKAFYEESRSKVRDWILGQAGDGDTGGIVTGSVDGPVREVVNQAFAEHGWHEGAQWDAVDYIVTRESGWNPNAQNPSSSAYGLFQFLDQTWGTVGGRKTSDPYEQGVYGARYMAQRYGDPVSARRFWEANNYYDQGGLAKHIGMMLK
ncbi:transglycosylase SLT domain-containing protein, partial [Hoyosella altamirensis]|uniref:aggregation-promoting factor C-terminal-like domain-containing protein n=1 Tax=Hoyosella altamirensis TaxID=616997 RepID=UPI000AE026FE